MRWRDLRRSENVEDQRRLTPATAAVGGGLGTLLIIVVALLFGADPRQLLQQVAQNQQAAGGRPGAPGGPGAAAPLDPAEEERKEFVQAVLGSTEDVWNDLFRQAGRSYQEPKLDLFSRQVRSACGFASSAVGPFYCPGDDKVYLDLAFFNDLQKKFKAPGEFAQAYVVAHEVGHHVQNLLGISRQIDAQRRRLSEAEANALSVRMELQADFLAGVWAHHAHKMKNILEQGDVESALRAATAIGDDRLQKQAQGYVVPDAFTHGTSEQRVRWFRKGLETGDMNQGDTFKADRL
jgi:predicted metalloprotease